VQVDQGIEAPLRTGEEPVDWPLLVASDMIAVKLIQKVVPDAVLTLLFDVEGLLDKPQILLIIFRTKCQLQKLLEAFGDIVRGVALLKRQLI